jgi:hypothetical protein
MLFEMYTGKTPFKGSDQLETFENIKSLTEIDISAISE